MYNIEEKFLNDLIKEYGRAMVGHLCTENELIKDRTDLNNKQKFDILKTFQRELIYQNLRDLRNQIRAYSLAIQYNKFNVAPLDSE